VRRIAEGMPEEWQQHWAGTHFFNPPRYLKLVEIIPGIATHPEVIEFYPNSAITGSEKASSQPRTLRISSVTASEHFPC